MKKCIFGKYPTGATERVYQIRVICARYIQLLQFLQGPLLNF